jgi:excisionase family DNA binding protein
MNPKSFSVGVQHHQLVSLPRHLLTPPASKRVAKLNRCFPKVPDTPPFAGHHAVANPNRDVPFDLFTRGRGADLNQVHPYLRPKDVLVLLPVSKSTFWRWVRSGKLTAHKLGPRITVFSREEVMDVFFSEVAR